ncbi:MAG: DNA polymerase/3'-5' exonuclease PolX [Methanomicrobiaceae archaeon]|nr:DNA polymerase/3'-5' exonuclease PolX [Methanomicrobiaceae archaeon]
MAEKKVSNAEIASILFEIADLLELKGVAFKPRAYHSAAQTIESLGEDITEIAGRGELEEISGVGESIAEKIRTVIEKGNLPYLDRLREDMPEGVRELMELEGIGPKKALFLHTKLGVSGIEDLEAAAKKEKVRELEGFGETSEQNIIDAIAVWRERHERFLLGYILHDAEEIERKLREHDAVKKVCLAGSIRRRRETVGDVDILVSTGDPEAVSKFFCSLPEARRVVMEGPKRSSIVVGENLHVDLRVIDGEQFGAALQYFTGSRAHNIKLRKIALDHDWKLSEYGLVAREGGDIVAREHEEEIYEALGLAFIPPELRENRGEIEAADEGTLPDLIGYGEMRGDLHAHTRWSDGSHTVKEMAEAARDRGWEYLIISDHSAGLAIAHGLSGDEIRKQANEIEKVNNKIEDITVLHGIEANIDKDGTIDVKKSVLRDLDFVVGSVHSAFKMTEKEMTERVVTAIHHEHLDMIGHPTGRLIQKREPHALDLDTVFEEAASAHVLLEINAFPTRFDLSDVNCRRARDAGVMLGISTDAHDTDHLRFLDLGVAVARRGWLEAGTVINTRSLEDLRAWLEK